MAGYDANFQALMDSASRTIVARRARETHSAAKSGAGAVAKDIRYTVTGNTARDLSAKIGSNETKVRVAEEGIRPYTIRPVNGKVLVFPGSGAYSGKAVIHSTVVHHPGHPGRHFLRNALRRTMGRR